MTSLATIMNGSSVSANALLNGTSTNIRNIREKVLDVFGSMDFAQG